MMDKYAMHLMVLSHVYRVNWLKKLCESELSLRLTADSVVDMLQLARQCDVPKLYLQCMKLLRKEFAAVEKTEAWIFLQNNDPLFELEILQFLEDEDPVCVILFLGLFNVCLLFSASLQSCIIW